MSKTTIHLDFETRSTADLKKAGVYAYAEHSNTDVLCMAYCIGDGPAQIWTPADDSPEDIYLALQGPAIVVAHNANFERVIWNSIMVPRYGWPTIALEEWRCTMTQAYAMSLPGSLDAMAAALGLDHRKDAAGHRIMMQLCRPRRMEGDTPVWWDDPVKLQKLYDYCRQDVEVEREAAKRLVPLSKEELALWHLDQRINDRGVLVDTELADAAVELVEREQKRLDKEMRRITGQAVTGVNATAQLTRWLAAEEVDCEGVDKEEVADLLGRPGLPAHVRAALEVRKEGAKASVAKITALVNGKSRDGRARGLLQYHAASTGRWAGRRFQPQNIRRPATPHVDGAIAAVLSKDVDLIEDLYGTVLTTVGDCIRGMVIAEPGHRIMAADFSNIEGRVLAWLAGEERKLAAFRAFDAGTGPDLYKVAASGIYGVPVSAVSKDQRQVGKVAELACGYQGGVGAFQKMGAAYGMVVPDEQADEIKKAWREANPNIVKFWRGLEEAAVEAVQNPGWVTSCGKIKYRMNGSFLWCQLPNRRVLCYCYPKLVEVTTPWGARKEQVVYKGVNSYTRKWEEISTYGGKLAENVTQAVARDFMAAAMTRLEAAGYPIMLTVHDEIVAEPPEGHGSVEEFEAIMCEVPAWGAGCPIAAEGFADRRYRK